MSTGFLRRVAIVLIGLAPIGLLVASLVHAFRYGDAPRTQVAYYATLTAIAIGAANFHLSFVRPRLHRREHGSMDGYKHLSGIPFVGAIAVVVAALAGYGSIIVVIACLVVVAIDTGGPLWLVLATWKDKAFWDS